MSDFLAKAPLFLVGLLFFSLPISVASGDFAAIFLIFTFLIALAQKKATFEFNFLAKAILIFALGFLISALMSNDPVLSLAYVKKFWKFLLPFAVYWALKDKDLAPSLKWLVASSVGICIYSLVQYKTGLDVLRSASLQAEYVQHNGAWLALGAFSHHLTFGGVCLLLFGLFLGLASESSPQRKYYILAALLNLLAVFASHGRSSWLGAVVVLSVFIILRLPKRLAIVLGILGLITVASLYSARNSDFIQQHAIGKRLASAMNVNSNIDRLYMWEAGVDMISDRPIFGFGASKNEEMSPYYKAVAVRNRITHGHKYKHVHEHKQKLIKNNRKMHTHEHNFQHKPTTGVHNLYLQTWVNFGFLGFLAQFFWLFSIPVLLIKSYLEATAQTLDRRLEDKLMSGVKLGLAAGLLGSLFSGIFENNFRDAEVQTVILTFHGLGLILLAQKHRKHNS
ncbi:MAG: O-antigen ligase family protein [SAR324 cluster bacterium]|nr:O-antigen ligase family protein [SAR324 cluster bacterium]